MDDFIPSLFAIYKQTRATKAFAGQNPMHRQQQRERVAVAMLSVALLHEAKFRDAFLRLVCGYKGKELAEWKIELEAEKCGDLVLRSESFVAVCEFKIDAPLKPHQHPDSVGGYRDKMDQVYAHIPRRTYVVVQKAQSSEASARGLFRTWQDVRDAGLACSSLVTDLFASLASLEIPAFSYGRTAQMKLTQNAHTAAQIFKLLENVAEGRFGFKKTGWDVSDEENYFGKTVAPDGLATQQELLQTPSGDLAWYGYEGGQLSVWFYAGAKGTKSVQKKLEKMWPELVIVDETNIGVRIDPSKVSSDQNFFEKTLGVVFQPK